MALTSQEQNKVVQLLGYGGKILQAGSVIYNKILNDRLNQLPVDTENLVRTYLGSVTAIEQQMAEAPARLVASKVQDLEMNHKELEMLRAERRRIGREIAAHLDVPYQAVGGVNVGVKA